MQLWKTKTSREIVHARQATLENYLNYERGFKVKTRFECVRMRVPYKTCHTSRVDQHASYGRLFVLFFIFEMSSKYFEIEAVLDSGQKSGPETRLVQFLGSTYFLTPYPALNLTPIYKITYLLTWQWQKMDRAGQQSRPNQIGSDTCSTDTEKIPKNQQRQHQLQFHHCQHLAATLTQRLAKAKT